MWIDALSRQERRRRRGVRDQYRRHAGSAQLAHLLLQPTGAQSAAGAVLFPLFFACDYHTLIRPLPTFLAAGEAGEYQELSIGEHMWSQALQTYRYLREKVNRGELQLPERARHQYVWPFEKTGSAKNP